MQNPSAFSLPAPPSPLTLMGEVREWALFLDFDGTLVELADSPDAIQIPAELPTLLRALDDRFAGALAILTGRALSDLDAHLPGLPLAAAGQHGAERRLASARPEVAENRPELAGARGEIERFVARHPGVLMEDKGASIALHYRAVPAAKPALTALVEALAGASGGALEWIAGKAVCELRPAGSGKGRALRAFLEEPPFAGRRPLVLGDDVTDEAAFAVARDAAGSAIKVGAGESSAPWRLAGPPSVRVWLARILD